MFHFDFDLHSPDDYLRWVSFHDLSAIGTSSLEKCLLPLNTKLFAKKLVQFPSWLKISEEELHGGSPLERASHENRLVLFPHDDVSFLSVVLLLIICNLQSQMRCPHVRGLHVRIVRFLLGQATWLDLCYTGIWYVMFSFTF